MQEREPSNQVIPVATIQNVIRTVEGLRKEFHAGEGQVVGGVYDLGTQVVTVVAP